MGCYKHNFSKEAMLKSLLFDNSSGRWTESIVFYRHIYWAYSSIIFRSLYYDLISIYITYTVQYIFLLFVEDNLYIIINFCFLFWSHVKVIRAAFSDVLMFPLSQWFNTVNKASQNNRSCTVMLLCISTPVAHSGTMLNTSILHFINICTKTNWQSNQLIGKWTTILHRHSNSFTSLMTHYLRI